MTPEEIDERRMQMCCMDCGRKYGDEYGFPDLVVPHDVWEKISPTHDEGGLLCPSCMCRRAYDTGTQCQAVFRSGPFCQSDEERDLKLIDTREYVAVPKEPDARTRLKMSVALDAWWTKGMPNRQKFNLPASAFWGVYQVILAAQEDDNAEDG